jgi:hypothetical protein
MGYRTRISIDRLLRNLGDRGDLDRVFSLKSRVDPSSQGLHVPRRIVSRVKLVAILLGIAAVF